MSRERYLQALRCRGPAVLPHQLWLSHPEFIRDATGVDYYDHPKRGGVAFPCAVRRGQRRAGACRRQTPAATKAGKTADGGERSGEGFGTVWHNASPFTEPEQLWDFDPAPWGFRVSPSPVTW